MKMKKQVVYLIGENILPLPTFKADSDTRTNPVADSTNRQARKFKGTPCWGVLYPGWQIVETQTLW